MRNTVYVFNGPNLNLLGQREPEIYGRDTLAQVEARCRALTDARGLKLDFRQTNAEHVMVDWFQEVRLGAVGIAFNPAAFTYAGYPILDAIKMVDCPVIEVHISEHSSPRGRVALEVDHDSGRHRHHFRARRARLRARRATPARATRGGAARMKPDARPVRRARADHVRDAC